MELEKIKEVYFIGIGGIGMSALARYFKAERKKVSGYDKTQTSLTDELEAEGIDVHFSENISALKGKLETGNFKQETLIVYTPAIGEANTELGFFREHGFTIKKRSEVLGMITANSYTIAVAGTHGKTTTSTLIAHILRSSGMGCTAFLGGISKNYHTNLLLNEKPVSRSMEAKVVVEADEYDRSFLMLNPNAAVITSMDADHLDIYGTHESMIDAYKEFSKKIKKGGMLFPKYGLDFEGACTTYSVNNPNATYFASNIRIEDHQYVFDIENKTENIHDVHSGMPGLHNVENAVAAAAVGQYLGISSSEIKKAIGTYTGVKRRFDLQFHSSRLTYIDDYAHHPEELRACISSVKEMYPGKKITGIFQPHLFSRTRDFAEGFSESLSLLDELILLDIYPAREEPIPGVSSEMLLKNVTSKRKTILSKEEAVKEVSAIQDGVVLTLGAGDIDQLVNPIAEQFRKR